MRGFVTLGRRELRDAMPSVVGFAVLVLVLVVGIVSLTETRAGAHEAVDRLGFLCLSSTTLFAAFVSADVVGGDISSRRIDLLALLPIAPGDVWRAKAASVLVAVGVMAAFTVGISAVAIALTASGEEVESFLHGLMTMWRGAGLAVSFAISGTMLLGSLRLRGVAAVCAAAITMGVLVVVGSLVATLRARSLASELPDFPLQVIVAAAALAGSAAGFIWGRVHVGVLRPAVIGGSVTLAALGIPLGVASAYVRPVGPDEPRVHLSSLYVHPAGRSVAIELMDDGRVGRDGRRVTETWVLGIPDGRFQHLPDARLAYRPDRPGQVWADDGTLWVATSDGLGIVRIDPVTNAEVGERVDNRQIDWLRGLGQVPPDRTGIERRAAKDDEAPEYLIRPPGVGDEPLVLRSLINVTSLGASTLLFAPSPRELAVRPVRGGESRTIVTAETDLQDGDIGPASPDGAWVLVRLSGEWTAIDVASGRRAGVGSSGAAPKWIPVIGDPGRRVLDLMLSEGHPTTLLDLATGRRAELEVSSLGSLHAVEGGMLLHSTGRRLDLYDADLKLVRQLWRRVEDRR